MRISDCMGCKGSVKHTHSRVEESIDEAAYCDECLKQLGAPPRGRYADRLAYDREWAECEKEAANG